MLLLDAQVAHCLVCVHAAGALLPQAQLPKSLGSCAWQVLQVAWAAARVVRAAGLRGAAFKPTVNSQPRN